MTISTKIRTRSPEIMDDFAIEGEVLKEALDKIAKINQLLGGNQLTLQGIKKLLKNIDKTQKITIVDVGCGNGDMLRKIAEFGLISNYSFKLIGIDANPFTINYARKLSIKYLNISFDCQDIFDKQFSQVKYDILLCTLTLHHFKDDEIESLLHVFFENSRTGIIINDLQRSKISYRLFQLICKLFNLNEMSKQDGLTSILRGFKKRELIDFSKNLNFKKYSIHWKWAFRYQWIIKKEKET
ncbi:MAG: methyltransferase domain-containing protein [Flavobacterium sp.]|nr:methyltransferase domain-containing protein [Flavobacterium sp.]